MWPCQLHPWRGLCSQLLPVGAFLWAISAHQPVDASEPHIPACKQGGAAVADVLFGDVSPGGRLPVSFPFANYTAQSEFTDMSMRRWPGRTHRYLQVTGGGGGPLGGSGSSSSSRRGRAGRWGGQCGGTWVVCMTVRAGAGIAERQAPGALRGATWWRICSH